jgi:predicted dienelactone hydrolase
MKERKSRLKSFLLIGLVGLYLLSFARISCGSSESKFQGLFNVGFRIIDLTYQNGKNSQKIVVAVWYPTAAQPKPYSYGGPTVGNVAVNAAPLSEGNFYPLLVFSHGYGGGGIGAVFFTEALAARGWIVACPDHNDLHSAVRIKIGQKKDFDRIGLFQHAKKIAASDSGDRAEYLYRLDEMRSVLDSMLTSDLFGKLIDKDRIAVGGHSFGGFTALGLAGTIEERHDPRIKALLLFSTGAGGYLYNESELKKIRIPSMLLIGEQEEDQLRGKKTMSELSSKIFGNVSPPKYFIKVKGASHFSFNNRFAENRWTRLMSGTEEQFDVIRRYSIAFLQRHVSGREDPGKILEHTDAMLTQYLRETKLDESNEIQSP